MNKRSEQAFKMPVLFLGHGSPMNAIEENEFVNGFRNIYPGCTLVAVHCNFVSICHRYCAIRHFYFFIMSYDFEMTA